MTALQPPPPSPTHSVNPNHSAFGTTTLYAEKRATVLPTGDVQTGATAFFFSACGHELFCSRGSQPCGKCLDGYQSMPPQRQQPIRLADHLVSSHSCSTTCCTSAPTNHPGFHSPVNAACAYSHNGSDAPSHAHTALHPVPTRLCLSDKTMVRPDGTQRNFVCGNLLVRYIPMRFRPTPAEFITATTAFPRPNWPQRHPTKPPK